MKISAVYRREYPPHHDHSCDPEDWSSHLYYSEEDTAFMGELETRYHKIANKFVLIRNSSLTTLSVDRPLQTQIRNENYQVYIFLTTESESNPTHPKELTDLLKEKGFKSATSF